MSSIDISSTNDVTSTAASDTNGSFATTANGAQATAHVLTTDGIIRECIKQGFYRNPICNEKLYLHNRGYDSIAPTAFEPYTDVKVLWLEGNGLSTLPCGAGYTQVRPPVRVDPFATELAEAEAEREALSSAAAADAQTSGAAHSTQHVDPNGAVSPQSASTSPNHAVASTKPPLALPLAADVPPEDRDAFSSLYPTVRQLYLHNNLFRVMPDLSRFERLDSVNLSGNFFSTVEPHCASYDAAACRYRAGGDAEGACRSPSKSLQREREQQQQAVREAQPDATTAAASSDLTVVMASSSEPKRQRAAQLEQQRRTADVFSVLCEHSPLPEREEAPRPAAVGDAPGAGEAQRRASAASSFVRQPPLPAPEHRNPCSSLRSLNFAGNRLETFEDCLGLLCYRALAVLDLSHNHIADGEALLLILERLPRLQSLKLSGNPLVRSLPRYRKRVLSRCKGLLHLDDRPVFEEERRLVTAWAVGGDDGEEKERHAIRQERAAAEKKRLEDFRRLISRHQRAGDDGPHAEYVNAITTVTALSAAVDTADAQSRRRRAGREGRAGRRQQQQQRGRHTASDPDSSPTSSDSEEEEERDAGAEVEAAQVSAPRGTFATATVTSTGAVRSSFASPGSDRIVRSHENKPSSVAARSPTQQQQRVLSSNQHVAPVEAASSAARGSNGDDEGEDEGSIFVPGAP